MSIRYIGTNYTRVKVDVAQDMGGWLSAIYFHPNGVDLWMLRLLVLEVVSFFLEAIWGI